MTRAIGTARHGLAGVLALGLVFAGCASMGTGGTATGSSAIAIQDPPSRPGLPSILIAMPSSPDFVDARRGLVAEIQKAFNISTLLVTRETPMSELAAAIERSKPVCAVLMNNVTLALFQAYEAAHKDKPALPTVVLMSSLLDEVRGQLRRAAGISYEVPGVIAVVNLRAIIRTPIHRVGVVYRPVFKSFINRQLGPAVKEHVSIIGRELARDFSAEDLRGVLRTLITKDKVDALWMLNDNLLVRDAQFLDDTWHAELRAAKLPLIVGVSNLVDPMTSLGTLAVVPDHEALGLQAANLIFDLSENEWQVERHGIDLPLSVKTIVDLRQIHNLFQLRPDAAARIDRALE